MRFFFCNSCIIFFSLFWSLLQMPFLSRHGLRTTFLSTEATAHRTQFVSIYYHHHHHHHQHHHHLQSICFNILPQPTTTIIIIITITQFIESLSPPPSLPKPSPSSLNLWKIFNHHQCHPHRQHHHHHQSFVVRGNARSSNMYARVAETLDWKLYVEKDVSSSPQLDVQRDPGALPDELYFHCKLALALIS